MPPKELSPDQIVGRSVRRLREAIGMTQQELGDRLAGAGATARWQPGVAALEQGRRRIGVEDVLVLARILEVTPQVLWAVRERGVDVRLGEVLLPRDEWHVAMRVTDEDLAYRLPRSSTSYVVAERQRRRKTIERQVQRVLESRREEGLARRSKYPGPTYVADRPVAIEVEIGAPAPVMLKLQPGEPWVARDRLETEALRSAAERHMVRRVSRNEARRLRATMKSRGG